MRTAFPRLQLTVRINSLELFNFARELIAKNMLKVEEMWKLQRTVTNEQAAQCDVEEELAKVSETARLEVHP